MRDARDAALQLAAGRPEPVPSAPREARPDPEPAVEHRRPEQARQAETPAPPAPPTRVRKSPWQAPTVDDHLHRIEAALFSPGTLGDEDLAAQLSALLRHPDLAAIGCAERVEERLAQAISDTIPRSDVLIGPAMARFGWAEKAKGWACPWTIEAAVARYRDCWLRDQAYEGDHGPAMRVLADPAPRKTNFLIAWAVRQFLEDMRADYPSVEREFDAATIAWWDAELERRRQGSAWRMFERLRDPS